MTAADLHGAAFCSGDGNDPRVVTPCPCNNFGGSPGHGCANSVDANGALLRASGATNPDTITLTATGMPASAAAIYLKGDQEISAGAVFGDGLRCAGGALIRLGQEISVNGASSFPSGAQLPVSIVGNTPPGSGLTGYYQAYYRNPEVAFCPPATFNITNGWRITW